MKKYFYFLLMTVLPLSFWGQAPVYDAPNHQAAMAQIQRTEAIINQLSHQIDWLRTQAWIQLETFIHQDSLADEQLNTERLLDLQLAEQSEMFSQLQNLDIPISAYDNGQFSGNLPAISEQDATAANELYEFFYPGSPAFLDAEEDRLAKLDQREKRRSMIDLLKKQRMHMALVYLKIAHSEALKAEELREYLLHSDVLSMSEGERVAALLKVDDVLARSLHLRREAIDLLQQALEPDSFEQLELEMESARWRLRENREQLEELIPGYKRN